MNTFKKNESKKMYTISIFFLFSYNRLWIIFLLPNTPLSRGTHIYILYLYQNITKQKTHQTLNKQTKKIQRKYGVHFVLVGYWAWGQPRNMVDIPSDTLVKKTDFAPACTCYSSTVCNRLMMDPTHICFVFVNLAVFVRSKIDVIPAQLWLFETLLNYSL